MILRLLLVTLEEEDNLGIYDSIFWLSLIKCPYIPSPLPVLGNDGAGKCRRLLHRIKMVLSREPLTCARSSFCWNHLHVPDLYFVGTTSFASFCNHLPVPILLFETTYCANSQFCWNCAISSISEGGYKIDLKDYNKM